MSLLQPNGTVVFIVLLLEGAAHAGFQPQTAKRWPGFRHKPRNTPETGMR
jgi:hypothetical protein